MIDWQELYQETILEHNKNPENFRKIASGKMCEGYNPLCGDHYSVYTKVVDNILEDISFEGRGCAISKASASIMTSILKNKSLEESILIFKNFKNVLENKSKIDDEDPLIILKGVSKYPSRMKCVTLCWHAMMECINFKDC